MGMQNKTVVAMTLDGGDHLEGPHTFSQDSVLRPCCLLPLWMWLAEELLWRLPEITNL